MFLIKILASSYKKVSYKRRRVYILGSKTTRRIRSHGRGPPRAFLNAARHFVRAAKGDPGIRYYEALYLAWRFHRRWRLRKRVLWISHSCIIIIKWNQYLDYIVYFWIRETGVSKVKWRLIWAVRATRSLPLCRTVFQCNQENRKFPVSCKVTKRNTNNNCEPSAPKARLHL